jgi:hypothetical protein
LLAVRRRVLRRRHDMCHCCRTRMKQIGRDRSDRPAAAPVTTKYPHRE